MNLAFDFINQISLTSQSIADLVFFIVVSLVAIISAILLFHWKKYGLFGTTLGLVGIVYLTVCVILVSIAFFSIS